MTLGKTSLLCIFLAAVFLSLGSSASNGRPLQVCVVLRELNQHRDKQVTVEGRLFPGRHGTVLVDLDNQEECPALTKKGVYWPSSLYVTWGTRENQRKLRDAIRVLYSDNQTRGKPFEVVARGVISTKKKSVHISKVEERSSYWHHIGNGYGMGGAYPAAISITEITLK